MTANPTNISHTPATLDDVVAELRIIRESFTSPPAELIDRDAFAATLSIGTSTFDKNRAAHKIGPKPVGVGGALRWNRAEVLLWIQHPDQGGELHDEKTWPAVWESIRRKAGLGR